MNTNLTEIACIVDRSGSMGRIREDAIGGFNTFLQEQKKVPGDARLTLVLFNHEYMLACDGETIGDVRPLNEETYQPGGTTALLDAVGRTIDMVGARLAQMPKEDRPGRVIMTILTDGLENASSDYSLSRVSEMIAHQQEKYSWEFIFLAANQDAIKTAGGLSIAAEDAHSFEATGVGTRAAYSSLSADVRSRRLRP